MLEQLAPAVELADESSDHEWAERAQHCSPGDLARLARTKETPSVADREQRVKARFLRTWWGKDSMLHLRGALPDVDGVFVEGVLKDLIERMRPAKGQRWDTPAHRGADAVVAVCAAYDKDAPLVARPVPRFVVQIPPEGPAEIAGIPLPDEMVEALRAEARLEPVAVDSFGAPVATGRVRSALSEKIKRAVLLRDGHCRCGMCETYDGLQVHHLLPVSWGGTDDLSNLASVCALGPDSHHGMLVPYGEWVLEGNPNRPDGLRFVHISQATQIRPPPGWQRGRQAQPPAA